MTFAGHGPKYWSRLEAARSAQGRWGKGFEQGSCLFGWFSCWSSILVLMVEVKGRKL